MAGLSLTSLRLASGARSIESLFPDQDITRVRPPLANRLREHVLSTYRLNTGKDRLEALFG